MVSISDADHTGWSETYRIFKKRNVYAGIGENVMIQSRKIPLYPELIRIGNNVRMAFNVLFVTHDVVHNMLNRISPKTEKFWWGEYSMRRLAV